MDIEVMDEIMFIASREIKSVGEIYIKQGNTEQE